MKFFTPLMIAVLSTALAYADPLKQESSDAITILAKELQIGITELESDDKETLNSAHKRFLRVSTESKERKLITSANLNLGRVLIKLKHWEEARKHLGKLNRFKGGDPYRGSRPEINFLYGVSLEKLGKADDAISVYNGVIAIHRSYIEWSSQALEHGFELAYQNKDPEEKLNAYRYLRKVLWMFDGYVEKESVSGALTRLRRRLPMIKSELGLSPEQFLEIDLRLGIMWTHLRVEGEDATSKHYYFYNTDIEVAARVRWVWNGGAQNRPTVSDYVLDSGKITIRHLVGSRDSIPELISGGVAELELKEEYSIDSIYSVEKMRLIDSKKILSEKQRIDLGILADLLTKGRKEITP